MALAAMVAITKFFRRYNGDEYLVKKVKLCLIIMTFENLNQVIPKSCKGKTLNLFLCTKWGNL